MPPLASPPWAGIQRAPPCRCAARQSWPKGGEGGGRGRASRAEEKAHVEAETRVDLEEVVE